MTMTRSGNGHRAAVPALSLTNQGCKHVNSMEEPILRVEHLSHTYSIQWAVKDINFALPQGGVCALLGSNGAGKSTIMNIVAGIIKPTKGDAFVAGVNVGERPMEAKSHIGFLPQFAPLYKDLTIGEYLSYCAAIHDVPEARIASAVDEAMERCGVSHFRKRLIRNLSGGYRQRVGIAQAIIHHPALVILDEPTNALDPNQVLEVRQLIKEISAESTVILSTHILTEVMAVSDHILMIEKGTLAFNGSIHDFHSSFEPDILVANFRNKVEENVLARLEGVSGVEKDASGMYRLHFRDSRDLVESLLKTNAERGWGLTEMWIEQPSLESVFNELSGNTKK